MHRDPDDWSDLALACLAEALKADRVSPNPRVGALILDDDGHILARGYHRGPGRDHAEVDAVKNYQAKCGQDLNGKTIMVNLEPCSHFGRTPPCSDLLIEQGFGKVIIPFLDPYHEVSGRGVQKLRDKGIRVVQDFGSHKDLAAWINRGFLKAVRQKMPWLTLKMATTLDGKIADRFGGSRYVTGSGARQQVMDLRQNHDCVLVGKGTVLFDDPRLDVRSPDGIDSASSSCKAVIDARLEIGTEARVFDPELGPTILFYDRALDNDFSMRKKLAQRQARHPDLKCLGVEAKIGPGPDSQYLGLDLTEVMSCLYDLGLYQILCEGGSRLASSLLEADLVDQIVWFVAPTLMLDAHALSVVAADPDSSGKNSARSIAQVQRFINCNVAQVGQDTRIDLLSGDHADLADCPGRLHLIK